MDEATAKAVAAIRAARDLISYAGWVRGELCSEGGYCIVGAILEVEKNVDTQELAFWWIRQKTGGLFVSAWNDTRPRNGRDVTAFLDHVRSYVQKRAEEKPKPPGLRGSIYS